MLSRRAALQTIAGGVAWLSTKVHAAERPPWLQEIQVPPAPLPNNAAKLSPLLVDGAGQAITTLSAWQKQREVLQARWRKFLGALTAPRDKTPKLTVIAEDQADGVVRQRVSYDVEPGLTTEAFLLRPQKPTMEKRPGVVVFHSTVDHSIHQSAGTKGEAAKAFGWQLARQGYVTFCPRNYLWPTNDKIDAKREAERFLAREPKCLGMAKMLFDAQVALDILIAQEDVDAKRLGAVGHSLGAKEVLYLAAFDDRVKSTISSEGGVGIGFSNWHDAWYLGPKVKEEGFALEHHELLALVAPRAFLLIGGDSADGAPSWPFIIATQPVYKLYGGDALAHLGLWNHRRGHSVPEEMVQRVGEWFKATL